MHRKMTDPLLVQLRHDLPTIAKISQVFGASPSLVRRWYNGQRGVSPRYREKIRNYNRTGFPLPLNESEVETFNIQVNEGLHTLNRYLHKKLETLNPSLSSKIEEAYIRGLLKSGRESGVSVHVKGCESEADIGILSANEVRAMAIRRDGRVMRRPSKK